MLESLSPRFCQEKLGDGGGPREACYSWGFSSYCGTSEEVIYGSAEEHHIIPCGCRKLFFVGIAIVSSLRRGCSRHREAIDL